VAALRALLPRRSHGAARRADSASPPRRWWPARDPGCSRATTSRRLPRPSRRSGSRQHRDRHRRVAPSRAAPKPDLQGDPLRAKNVLLAGTSVVAAKRAPWVYATGMRTEFGRIARSPRLAHGRWRRCRRRSRASLPTCRSSPPIRLIARDFARIFNYITAYAERRTRAHGDLAGQLGPAFSTTLPRDGHARAGKPSRILDEDDSLVVRAFRALYDGRWPG